MSNISFELKKNVEHNGKNAPMSFRTGSVDLKLTMFGVKAYSTLKNAKEELQPITMKLYINSAGSSIEAASTKIDTSRSDYYYFNLSNNPIILTKNTLYTINLGFYNEAGSSTSAYVVYYDTLQENEKKPYESTITITSENGYYCKVGLSYEPKWSLRVDANNGYLALAGVPNTEMWDEFIKPKPYGAWLIDESVNNGYPYILTTDTPKTSNLFRYNKKIGQWEEVSLFRFNNGMANLVQIQIKKNL